MLLYWETPTLCVIVVTLCAVTVQSIFPVGVNPAVASGGECPSNDARQVLRGMAHDTLQSTVIPLLQNCGPGNWRQVFYLNTSNPDESCPGAWNTITSPVRACAGDHASCVSIFSNDVTTAYNRVCGRVYGDAINTPDAFFRYIHGHGTIEDNYLDGVSITHGVSGSRTHIWTLGAGHPRRCPCDNNDRNYAPFPPAEVGENYFCSRYDGFNTLWEGEGCAVDNPCCSFHNPPYFSIQLPEPTTDHIEIRICNDQSQGDESVLVHFAEIYVQWPTTFTSNMLCTWM